MADILPVRIPLPIPRPVMEEVHPVLDLPRFNLDIPLPEIPDINLYFEKGGVELMKEELGYMITVVADNWDKILLGTVSLAMLVLLLGYGILKLGDLIYWLWKRN